MSTLTAGLTSLEIAQHAYALDVSGFTVLRDAVGQPDLEALRATSAHTVDLVDAAERAGTKIVMVSDDAYYRSVRCMYCWGDAFVRLLEHDTIHALAEKVFGKSFRLWDLGVLWNRPAPPEDWAERIAWHRDFGTANVGARVPTHLWFFLCLEDATPENGSTWIVPGSHLRISPHEPAQHRRDWPNTLEAYPSRVQVTGRAGDILVLNPTALHTSGINMSDRPRPLLNIGVVHKDTQPFFNHWVIAGPTLRERAGERVRQMLGADLEPLPTTWSVLPDGWETGAR